LKKNRNGRVAIAHRGPGDVAAWSHARDCRTAFMLIPPQQQR
jgi:hypothetical protein